jgi:hypothetical protein
MRGMVRVELLLPCMGYACLSPYAGVCVPSSLVQWPSSKQSASLVGIIITDDVTPRRVFVAVTCYCFASSEHSTLIDITSLTHNGEAEQAVLGTYHLVHLPARLTAARRPPAQRQLRRRMDARPTPVHPPLPRIAFDRLVGPVQGRPISLGPHQRGKGQRAAACRGIGVETARIRGQAAHQPIERQRRRRAPPVE